MVITRENAKSMNTLSRTAVINRLSNGRVTESVLGCGAPNANQQSTRRLRPIPLRLYSLAGLRRSRGDQQRRIDDTHQRCHTWQRSPRPLEPNEDVIQSPNSICWLESMKRTPRREPDVPSHFANCPGQRPLGFQPGREKICRRSCPSTPTLRHRGPAANRFAGSRINTPKTGFTNISMPGYVMAMTESIALYARVSTKDKEPRLPNRQLSGRDYRKQAERE